MLPKMKPNPKAVEIAKDCIHCGACTGVCNFLEKYDMDLMGFAERPELAYHCYLCRACLHVCPMDIDGADISLVMRRDHVRANDGKIPEDGYGSVIKEKKNYIFKNYKKGNHKTVLFPGCNFTSFYPKTLNHIVDLLAEHDIGVVYDCCGKPISELGLEKEENEIIERLEQNFAERGIEELVILCPNCYYYFRPRLKKTKITSIYDKFRELGIGNKVKLNEAHLFLPCPDKGTQEMREQIKPFIDGNTVAIQGVNCCGLGGVASVKEPELTKEFSEQMNCKCRRQDEVYTYCATCCGQMTRNGVNINHILVEILGTGERAEASLKSLWNRAKKKF